MEQDKLKQILEAALLAAGGPLSMDRLTTLFADDDDAPSRQDVRAALDALAEDCEDRGVELTQVASGYRYQAREELSRWISRLWEERPTRYSRALLETLALIAYRQPITRGDIEEVRGVAVSTSIIKTLEEREWVRVVGHREVPGRPAMYGTTRHFLDYFGLKSLDDLPKLSEIADLESIGEQLDLSMAEGEIDETEEASGDTGAEALIVGETQEHAVDTDETPAAEAGGADEEAAAEPIAVGEEQRGN